MFAYQPGDAPAPRQASAGQPAADRGRALAAVVDATLDRLGIIACTVAAGDFSAPHYDPDLAREPRGFEDVFTDVYASLGFAQRFLGQGLGHAARIAVIELRLGASFYAGDTLHITGAIEERLEGLVIVRFRGTCAKGVHMTGVARLAAP